MRLTEIAKDAVEKVRAIFRKPDQEKEKKAEAAGEMIRKARKLEDVVIGCDLAAGEDRTGTLDMETVRKAFAQAGYDMDEVTKALMKIAETIAETITEAMKPFIDSLKWLNMDKWQIAKMEMSNNERRRKKLPMVRRRGYIRAEQLKRRSKK